MKTNGKLVNDFNNIEKILFSIIEEMKNLQEYSNKNIEISKIISKNAKEMERKINIYKID